MARQRWIRPEQMLTPMFADLSHGARILYLCLPCFCDDYGTHLVNGPMILAEVFTYDYGRNADWVLGLVTELVDKGLLLRLEHADTEWLYFVKWEDEQTPGMRHRGKTVNIPPAVLERLVADAVADRQHGDFFQTELPAAPQLVTEEFDVMAEIKRRLA
jgi:hypothetical protein